MDADERALLALQNEFSSSKKKPAAVVKNARAQTPSTIAESSELQSVKESLPGERVALDLASEAPPTFTSSNGIINDIIERTPDQTLNDFELPSSNARSATRSKRIDWRSKHASSKTQSRFAAQRKSRTDVPEATNTNDLQHQIAEENDRKIASMSESELLAQRQELLSSLDPALLAVFEKRKQQKQSTPLSSVEPDFGPVFTSESISTIPTVKSSKALSQDPSTEAPKYEDAFRNLQVEAIARNAHEYTSESEALQDDDGPNHVHTSECLPPLDHDTTAPSIHFPSGQNRDELDPNSETFLEDLKTKYFPTLQHDPSALAWMRQPTEAEDVADYHESNASLMPAQIRFDFKGNFLAPRTSREVQSDLGLHHHADAPLAAGYTIPELAHLCRSAFPTQACMAIQIIGRIMYKIGKKFYGDSISGKLRHLIEKSMVEKTLLERSADKHLSIRSYATEALWQANLGREGQIIEGQ